MNGSHEAFSVNLIELPNGQSSFVSNMIVFKNDSASYSSNALVLQNNASAFHLNSISLPNGNFAYHISVINIPTGPLWFGTNNGEVEWLPGLMWNGTEFVRYQMWDTVDWQTSVGHDTT